MILESKLSSFLTCKYSSQLRAIRKTFCSYIDYKFHFPLTNVEAYGHTRNPRTNFDGIFHINIPTPNLTTCERRKFPRSSIASRTAGSSVPVNPQVWRRLHLQMALGFPKAGGGKSPIPFLGENFQVNQIFLFNFGVWYHFFRHFLKELKVRKA